MPAAPATDAPAATSSAAPPPRAAAADFAGSCGEAVVALAGLCGRHPDPAGARRAAGEAVRAAPGEPTREWWRWVREAAGSADVPVRLIDAPPAEVVELARDGAAALTFLPGPDGPDAGGPGDWWLLGPSGRRGVSVRRLAVGGAAGADSGGGWAKGSARTLAAAAGRVDPASAGDGAIRWVVAGRAAAELSQPVHSADSPHPSPYAALRALFRPEWGDVRAIAVFALFVAILNLATPIAVESLVGTVAFGRLLQPVIVLATILLAFLAFQAALRLLQVWVAELIQRRMYVRVAADLARRLPRVTPDGMDGHSPPELVNRFFDVVTVQKVAAGLLLDGLNLVLGAVIGLGILAFYHPFLLGFDLVLLALMTGGTFLLGRGAVRTAIYESKQKYRMAAWLEELAGNPVAFRHAGGPAFAVDRADRLTADYLEARRKHFRVLVRQVAFALGLQAVAATALLSLGGWLVINGRLTLGQLVAAELIVTLVLSSFAKMGKHLEAWYDLAAAGDKLGVLFALPTERTDGALSPQVGSSQTRSPRAAGSPGATDGSEADRGASLTLDGLKVRGGGTFTLNLEPGECVGLLADPGAGKTGLAEALFGRADALGGRAELDGLPPRDYRPDALRRRVALAGPAAGGGAEVFAGTVAENVHLGRPGVTAADVRDALARVGLIETIDALPGGADAALTPGGAPLGEIHSRRLVLARALAGHPRLLVIDSLLDGCAAPTAADLLHAAAGRMGERDRTTLVLTRRAEIAAACDRAVRPDGSPIGTNRDR